MNESAPISQKILFVDDEPRLLEGIKRQLRREFDISVAEGAQQGLDTLASEGPFALVISDYNMPDIDGIEFLSQVYRLYPQTVLAMLTGRAELELAIKALHKGHVSRFLNKPCPKELLVQTISDCLEQYRLSMNEKRLQAQIEESNHKLQNLNQHLEELVDERTEALKTQYRYVSALTKMENSHEIISALLKTTLEMLPSMHAALFLSFDNDDVFIPHATKPHSFSPIPREHITTGIIADLLNQQKAWINIPQNHLSSVDLLFFQDTPRTCIPLNADQSAIGVLTLSGDEETVLDETLVNSLKTLANATASALISHGHLEARNEAQDAIITALAKLSEYRDNETGAHLLRLKKYCGLICDILSTTNKYKDTVNEQFKADLVRSSPMHDIGKVGIADAILKKPGKLSGDEFAIMQTHATIGGDTLRSVFEQYKSQTFIKSGMEVAYYHHEKWDGSGYPNGIAGEDIPLTARILTVADVYDALTTKRVYKPAFPREKAKALIEEGRGTHFDPDIVNAFLANEERFHQIADSMADEPIPS